MQAVLALVIGLFLSSNAPLSIQESIQSAATLVHRYERACGSSCLQELAIDLGGVHATKPDDTVVVRFCSKESLPMALTTAAASPGYLISILTGSYGYTQERILFLRSEDCLGPDPAVAATEFWAVPNGAALPPSVESIRSSQVRSETVGMEATSTEGTRNYRSAAQELAAKLRARPEAVGIVLGYYYRRPNAAMQRRLREVRTILEQSGLPQERYRVRLMRWTGERSVDPPETEPMYPSLFIVEVAGDSTRRQARGATCARKPAEP